MGVPYGPYKTPVVRVFTGELEYCSAPPKSLGLESDFLWDSSNPMVVLLWMQNRGDYVWLLYQADFTGSLPPHAQKNPLGRASRIGKRLVLHVSAVHYVVLHERGALDHLSWLAEHYDHMALQEEEDRGQGDFHLTEHVFHQHERTGVRVREHHRVLGRYRSSSYARMMLRELELQDLDAQTSSPVSFTSSGGCESGVLDGLVDDPEVFLRHRHVRVVSGLPEVFLAASDGPGGK